MMKPVVFGNCLIEFALVTAVIPYYDEGNTRSPRCIIKQGAVETIVDCSVSDVIAWQFEGLKPDKPVLVMQKVGQ